MHGAYAASVGAALVAATTNTTTVTEVRAAGRISSHT